MSLIDCSLEFLRRPISRYIHPLRYIYPVPFFNLLRPSISIYLYSVHTHTHAFKCSHVCACVDIHVYTPTNGRPVREVSLVSIGNQHNTRQTHTRGFHLTDPYEGFPSNRPIPGVSIRVTTSLRDPILPAYM